MIGLRSSAGRVIAPIVFGVLVIALWQAAVVIFDIKPFVLPSPLLIGTQFQSSLAIVWAAAQVTGFNALVGLLAGAILGIVAAVLSALARVLDERALPVITAAAVVPLVALAPVLYTMVGADAETA